MKIRMMALLFSLIATSCTRGGGGFEVSRSSVEPGSAIDWLGTQTRMLGDSDKFRLGAPLPVSVLTSARMKEENLGGAGAVRIISIVPSLDTEVCEQQTHLLSETKFLNANVERITISRDLPYAQSRFAEASGLTNLKYLSDYRTGDFGRKLGLELERNGLLARAVIVLDRAGIVRYRQIVPKIYALPDLNRAIEVANGLVPPA